MHTQPKTLKIDKIPSGHIFKIIDNDGVTILREYFEVDQRIGILDCKMWLYQQYGFPNETKE